jgi:hypothetical protein
MVVLFLAKEVLVGSIPIARSKFRVLAQVHRAARSATGSFIMGVSSKGQEKEPITPQSRFESVYTYHIMHH